MYSIFSIARQLGRIIWNQEIIMSALDDLKASVARETSVTASAVVLLQSLSQRLGNIPPDDTAALQQLKSDIDASIQPLADAVAANTIAAPKDAGGGQPAPAAPADTGGTDTGSSS